jgi:hypothetical protein
VFGFRPAIVGKFWRVLDWSKAAAHRYRTPKKRGPLRKAGPKKAGTPRLECGVGMGGYGGERGKIAVYDLVDGVNRFFFAGTAAQDEDARD